MDDNENGPAKTLAATLTTLTLMVVFLAIALPLGAGVVRLTLWILGAGCP